MDDERPQDAPTGDPAPAQAPHPPSHQAPHGAGVPPPGAPTPGPATQTAPTPDERTWALFAHLSALSGLFFPIAGQVVGPLLVWLLKKDTSPFVDHQGKEAVNFQLTMMILLVASGVVLFMGVLLIILLIGIPIVVVAAIAAAVFYLVSLIFAIVGAVKANEGTWYRYPMTWRFIR